jgi:homoserine kinase type II
LARLHAALACSPGDTLPIHQPARGTPVAGIKALLARVPIDRLESKAATLVRALRDRFDDLGSPGALPAQLVHDDYRAANILWDAGRVSGVLDFDEVGVGARVAEVARAAVMLGTRFRHWSPLARDSREAFLAGYGGCQPLTGAELDWLPALMAWHSIGSDLAGPYDPQWLDSALELSNEIRPAN